MGRRSAEATKARLTRRTRGDTGLRRFPFWLVALAECAFCAVAGEDLCVVLADAGPVLEAVCAIKQNGIPREAANTAPPAHLNTELSNETYLHPEARSRAGIEPRI